MSRQCLLLGTAPNLERCQAIVDLFVRWLQEPAGEHPYRCLCKKSHWNSATALLRTRAPRAMDSTSKTRGCGGLVRLGWLLTTVLMFPLYRLKH